MDVTIKLPRMLADLVHSDRQIIVDAETVGGALQALVSRHPELRVQLFDEAGLRRQNVMFFHNDSAADVTARLGTSDVVTILQAVSGG